MTRRATVTIVRTKGARFPGRVEHNGQFVTLESIFAAAGIKLQVVQRTKDFEGGRTSFDLEQLHRFMRSVGGGRGPWSATVLMVPTISYSIAGHPRVPRGVMFDSGSGNLDGPEREGCAVAANMAESDYSLLRTTAHELGHVFNLRHTLWPRQGTTLMYPTEVVRAAGNYPGNIRYEFETSDRSWLTDQHERDVRPGGSNFRDPVFPEDAGTELRLEISTRQRDVLPGEPVRVRYTLRNTLDQRLVMRGLPTLDSMRVAMQATSPGFGCYSVRAPVYACGGSDELALEPGATVRWSERLPADPRLDAHGEHLLEIRLMLDSDAGPQVAGGTLGFVRRLLRSDDDAELSRQLLQPWFRRALAHESICPTSNDANTATELLNRCRGVAALDELRLSLAAGLARAGEDHGHVLDGLSQQLDLEQQLYACALRGEDSTSLHQQLGYPESWSSRFAQSCGR